MNASRLISILLVTIATAGPAAAADLYQWIDSRGVIHFTDNLNNVPATVRNSQELKVRRNYLTPAVPGREPEPPALPSTADATVAPPAEPPPLAPMNPESPAIHNVPQEITIIVVNGNRRLPQRSSCAGRAACLQPFRPDFNDRRYIHPSVFDGGSRQYLQP